MLQGRPKGTAKTGGRQKGTPNRATEEFKEWALKFYTSPEYRKSCERRILAGKAPQLETYHQQMLYGRPPQTITFRGEAVARPMIGIGRVEVPQLGNGHDESEKNGPEIESRIESEEPREP